MWLPGYSVGVAWIPTETYNSYDACTSGVLFQTALHRVATGSGHVRRCENVFTINTMQSNVKLVQAFYCEPGLSGPHTSGYKTPLTN